MFMLKLSNSGVLKLSIFVTGISGIVAEYVLATMATYFLGNQLIQWTLIISVMLFSMGVGSRLSRRFEKHLIATFIITEVVLSLLVGLSAIAVYSLAALSYYEGLLIYVLSIAIGLLIGLEIPLVTRINNSYQNLKTNISSILEKDYYGSLLGGVFFAFIGLPYLGFTYTPLALALLNLSVATLMFFKLRNLVDAKIKKLFVLPSIMLAALLLIIAFAGTPKITLWGDQVRYKDKIVYDKQTKYQKITLTQWENNYWLYINHNQQLSTLDEYLYHEPLVIPIMLLSHAQNVLVIGGGDGCAVRELLKFNEIEKITLVDLDPEMTRLAMENPIFTQLNDSAFWNEKVHLINDDGKKFLEQSSEFYDAIIIDLPDPKTIELGMLYSREFYTIARKHLSSNGVMITQAGSPYYATKAFYCIEKTMQRAGLKTTALHNQVLTMGQWGWIMGSKQLAGDALVQRIKTNSKAFDIPTKWFSPTAIDHIFSFGKPLADTTDIEVNTLQNPVLYRYYNKGNWDLY
ncbi:polyamine aminopropyltransferase [bacterium]|nr:polyamine aminopropyltransferase [bacterium]